MRPFDSEIAPGQVRMLSGTERLTYALVARRWDDKSWLAIPFSDFAEPATEAELKVRIDGGIGLRVLQLWNARSLLHETLAKSWLVCTLPDAELEDAVSAWEWSVGVGRLTEDQLVRTGLPIMRRNDQRIEYENNEVANFAKIDAEDLAAAERLVWQEKVRDALEGRHRRSFAEARVFEADHALAAAEIAQPVAGNCRVQKFNGVVHVRYVSADRHLHIRVFGVDGNRSDALDGWGVFDGDARLLGMISGADFSYAFKSAFDGVLTIADDEGNVFPLISDENGRQPV